MKDIPPVEKNKDYEVYIERLGVNGEGVGRINNYTVFVEGALPGEWVKIKMVKVKKSYGYGKLLEVLQPSRDRIDSRCPVFKRCGGCSLQHYDYEAQLVYKQNMVKDILERIGGLKDIRVLPTLGMAHPWQYRNKAQFPVGEKDGNIVIGFYAARSHDIIDNPCCVIQHGINEAVIPVVKEYMDAYDVRPYDEVTGQGVVRHVMTRCSFALEEAMVVLVTTKSELPHKEQLIGMLRKAVPFLKGIVQNINNRRTNVILGERSRVLYGRGYIYDSIGPFKFKISPLSFFQVNPQQTKVLYDKALEYANLTGHETVIDAYCGIGTISLFLAQRALKVYGLEIVKQAVEDARENARINNVDNVSYLTGKAEDLMADLKSQGIKADVVVLDPPRKGCDTKLLEAMVDIRPKRVVYVSCNPATLARDLKHLTEAGFKAEEVQPVDMFAHTAHVETVCLMSRK
jgi:23S rRNA (uracil1939-C5)-methyltransferase